MSYGRICVIGAFLLVAVLLARGGTLIWQVGQPNAGQTILIGDQGTVRPATHVAAVAPTPPSAAAAGEGNDAFSLSGCGVYERLSPPDLLPLPQFSDEDYDNPEQVAKVLGDYIQKSRRQVLDFRREQEVRYNAYLARCRLSLPTPSTVVDSPTP